MTTKRTITGRAAFYLEHQKRIEEWASLYKDVTNEAHDFYCSLADPLEEAAQTLPGEPQVFAYLERTELSRPQRCFRVNVIERG